ncbi:MAG: Permeases of the drug/metabolite transporter (DMT) superfamily [Rhodobacteraceae bacterium HLUCCO07]|nr:MAG: Permeases of the drug/metabolite transporter (DMT) superfamily [Rhodobacteraceae bacterium HLUCCO07]
MMRTTPLAKPSNPFVLAALWMSGAILSFSTMAIAGREVSYQLDTFEIMMYRSFVGIVIVLGLATLTGTWREIQRRDLRTHAIRNFAHFAGQNLWFHAITLIPLAQVFALEFTSPIWVVLLSPLILGERLTPVRLLSALIGFCGILIVARPSTDSFDIGILMAAGSAICFAMTTMLTKKLTRTETVTCILFYLTVMQAVFGIVCAGIDGDIALPDAANVPLIVLIGCAGLLAHFCIAKALSLAPATVVTPIDFTRLPVIAVLGMLLYQEPLDLFVLLGAAVIFGGNYLNIWTESRALRKPA